MRKGIVKVFVVLFVLLSISVFNNAKSQTAGTLSVNLTTTFTGGSWGARSNFVLWIENASGTFVKTRVVYGNERDHLMQWKVKSPTQSTVDATVGTTRTTNPYNYTAIIWLANDLTGSTPYNLLPDGTYTVSMELAWASSKTLGTGRQIFSASFTKGPSPQTVTPANQTNFNTMTLQWNPAAQIVVTTSNLSSTTYCAGSTISVPFTKGTGTVFNNNVWTAQLSDASGSFASPVNIGTLSGVNAGTISATIPAGTVYGTAYRIRVVGSQPACTGANNGTNLTIAVTPTAPTVGTITQPSCSDLLGSVVLNNLPSTSDWTLTRTPGGTITTGVGANTTVTGIPTGTYTYKVTVANVCISPASGNVVINAIPATLSTPIIGTITQPICENQTGSVIINGLPSSGNWTLTQNPGGTTTNNSGTTTTLNNLPIGSYTYVVSNTSLLCPSVASNVANIIAQNQTPVVSNQTTSIIQGATFSVTPSSAPVGTTYIWSAPIYTGTVSGGSMQASQQANISGTLNGIGTATYTVTPTNVSCVGASFTLTVTVNSSCNPVSISTQASNDNMCLSSGNASFTVSANGSLPYVYQWQYYNGASWGNVSDGSPSGAIYTNSNTETLNVSGISVAVIPQYRCYVTNCSASNNATSNAVTLTVNDIPVPPTVGIITQPTCIVATGSVVLGSLPSSVNWTLTQTIGGATINGTGISTSINDLLAGASYSYTVSDLSTGCVSLSSNNIVINTQPTSIPTPTIGVITQPICSSEAGSVVLNELPLGLWSISQTPGGVINGSDVTTTITGLYEGTYTFTVTDLALGCVSLSTENVVIVSEQPTPVTPIISLDGNILHSDASSGNQWYDITTGFVNNAIDQDYTLYSDGDYYVIVTVNGCSSDTSNIITIINLGLHSRENSSIEVYPNPVTNELIIEKKGNIKENNFEIFDTYGKVVYKGNLSDKTIVQTSDFAPGAYFIKLEDGKTFEFKKILKK